MRNKPVVRCVFGPICNANQAEEKYNLEEGKPLVHDPAKAWTEVLQETDEGKNIDSNEAHDIQVDFVRGFVLILIRFSRAVRVGGVFGVDAEENHASKLQAVRARIEEDDKGDRVDDESQ